MSEAIDKIVELTNAGKLSDAVTMIHQLVDRNEDLKGANIALAHILLLAGDWQYINRLLPENTNTLMTSGFISSIGMGRPVNALGQPVPWFTYPAIDFLDGIVEKEWSVFEWGSGNSTLWWADRVASVVAVEDDADWYEEVIKQVPSKVQLLKKTEADYYSAITDFPANSFDVIVVDGSSRNDCARFALSRLKENGILIFDNSDNIKFSESSTMLKDLGFYRIDFWGLIPSYLYKNCTSLYFRDTEFLKNYGTPCEHSSSVGLSCSQAMEQNKLSR